MSQPHDQDEDLPLTERELRLLEYLGKKELPPDAVQPPDNNDKQPPKGGKKARSEDAPLIDQYGDLVDEKDETLVTSGDTPAPATSSYTSTTTPEQPQPLPIEERRAEQTPRAEAEKTPAKDPMLIPSIKPRPDQGHSTADRLFQGGQRTGGEAETTSPTMPWRPGWPLIGGGVAAVILLITFGFMLSRMVSPQTALNPTATLPAEVPTVATPVVVSTPPAATAEPKPTLETPTTQPKPTTTTPTPGIPTPTTNLTETIRTSFAAGLEFYAKKDWLNATKAFSEAFTLNPEYDSIPPIRDALSASLYNLSITQIDRANKPTIAQVQAMSEQFQHVATIIARAKTVPPDLRETFVERRQRAGEWVTILGRYIEGREAVETKDWDKAIELLESVSLTRDENGDSIAVLDIVDQRINAYRGKGEQLAGEGKYAEATTWYQDAKDFAAANGGDVTLVETAIALLPSPTPTATKVPTSAPAKQLRFVVANYNDEDACISVGIRGTRTSGWYFSVDGKTWLRGNFDSAGNARLCGLRPKEEVTITVFSGSGSPVAGGRGIPSQGSAIMVATWN
jgi:tetratricopeptide (TPR) repeat protein